MRSQCLLKLAALAVLVLSGRQTAAAQEPLARVRMSHADEIFTGQKTSLMVDLLVPGFFSGVPSVHLPEVSGLILVPSMDSPTIDSETIDGTTYTVQIHEIYVLPQRAGEVEIPSLSANLRFKRAPLDKDVVEATVKTETARFTVKTPPGAEGLKGVISARNLQVMDEWKPEPAQAKAGEAFTRTITFSAPDLPGMMFPPFHSGDIDGLGIYPKPPEILDQSDRGSLTGGRRDRVSYVCQRPGQFVIPAARFTWFDLDSKKLKTIDFPARTLDVAPNPAMASHAAAVSESPADHRRLWRGLSWAAAAGLVALFFWRTRRRWLPWLTVLRPVHLAALNPTETSKRER